MFKIIYAISAFLVLSSLSAGILNKVPGDGYTGRGVDKFNASLATDGLNSKDSGAQKKNTDYIYTDFTTEVTH